MKTFNHREGSIEDLLKNREAFAKFVGSIDTENIRSQRWFRRKNLDISRLKLKESFYMKPALRNRLAFNMFFVEVRYSDRSADTYFLPLAFTKKPLDDEVTFVKIRAKEGIYYAVDALSFPPFLRFINDCFNTKAIIKGREGSIVFEGVAEKTEPYCEPIPTNSTNSLIRYSATSILKVIRKIEEGINVEYEMGDFLTRNDYPHSPPLEGGFNYISNEGGSSTIGIRFKEIRHRKDAWTFTQENLAIYFDQVREHRYSDKELKETHCSYLDDVSELARVTALMHATMRKDKEHIRFRPEKLTDEDFERWEDSFTDLTKRSIDDAQKYVLDNPEDKYGIGKINLSADTIKKAFSKISKFAENAGEKTRIHCDFHLGQILRTRDGFAIIDFEGEPLRSVEERAAKYSPLRDVGGLLRSFHYAAFAAYFGVTDGKGDPKLEKYALKWNDIVGGHFYREYLRWVRKYRCASVPYNNLEAVKNLLALYKLEKAVYELCYELNNRPDWVMIPIEGIRSCLAELEIK